MKSREAASHSWAEERLGRGRRYWRRVLWSLEASMGWGRWIKASLGSREATGRGEAAEWPLRALGFGWVLHLDSEK